MAACYSLLSALRNHTGALDVEQRSAQRAPALGKGSSFSWAFRDPISNCTFSLPSNACKRSSSFKSHYLGCEDVLQSNSCFLFASEQPKFIDRWGRKACSAVQIRAFGTPIDSPAHEKVALNASSRTLYDVLGVPQCATDKDIKRAYRQLARRYHPDVVSEECREASTRTFLQIYAAYVTLSDPIRRAKYNLKVLIPQDQAASSSSSLTGSRKMYPLTNHCKSGTQKSVSNFSIGSHSSPKDKGRSWETDQCWC